jgi:hypothetical protein
MVRILRVTELVERRRALVAQSNIHRRTMELELANVRFAASLLKRRWTRLRNLGMLAATAASVATLFSARSRDKAAGSNGFFAKAYAGFRMGIRLMALLKRFQSPEAARPEQEETAQSR